MGEHIGWRCVAGWNPVTTIINHISYECPHKSKFLNVIFFTSNHCYLKLRFNLMSLYNAPQMGHKNNHVCSISSKDVLWALAVRRPGYFIQLGNKRPLVHQYPLSLEVVTVRKCGCRDARCPVRSPRGCWLLFKCQITRSIKAPHSSEMIQPSLCASPLQEVICPSLSMTHGLSCKKGLVRAAPIFWHNP